MWCVYSSWLLLLMLFPSHLSAQDDCSINWVKSLHFNSDLYLKLEDALINDHKSMLEELRVGFSSFDIKDITFEVEIHVVNGTNVTCDDHDQYWRWHPSFCPARNDTSEYKWELCHQSVKINFNVPSASEMKPENTDYEINYFLVWASSVHGSVLPNVVIYTANEYLYFNPPFEGSSIDSLSIKLNIDRLDCNPYGHRLKCDVSELLSWVSSSCIYLPIRSIQSINLVCRPSPLMYRPINQLHPS